MPETSSRPRLTVRLLAYVAADAFGVFCLALGTSWFFAGRGALLPGFPNSLVEAVAASAGGLAVMAWAMFKLLGHLRRPAP